MSMLGHFTERTTFCAIYFFIVHLSPLETHHISKSSGESPLLLFDTIFGADETETVEIDWYLHRLTLTLTFVVHLLS